MTELRRLTVNIPTGSRYPAFCWHPNEPPPATRQAPELREHDEIGADSYLSLPGSSAQRIWPQENSRIRRCISSHDALVGLPDLFGDCLCVFPEITRRNRNECDLPFARNGLADLR